MNESIKTGTGQAAESPTEGARTRRGKIKAVKAGTAKAAGVRRAKSDLKHRAILEAAAKQFKKKGYAETTLAEIGRLAGTFAGSIYYHFDSKEDLVEEVLNLGTTSVSEVVIKAIESLPPNTSYREKIRIALGAHFSQMLMKDDFIVAYWRIIDQVPLSIRKRHIQKPRTYGKFWTQLIDDAVAAGEIRSDVNRTMLRLIMMGTGIYALDWYDPKGDLTPTGIADEVINSLFDGVAKKGRARKGKIGNQPNVASPALPIPPEG